jgi:hypothetical protein
MRNRTGFNPSSASDKSHPIHLLTMHSGRITADPFFFLDADRAASTRACRGLFAHGGIFDQVAQVG